jgi:deoxyribodipyrimidine photo-lyase
LSTLLWIRRDLRVHDNPALISAIKNGATHAVFISTPKQWQQHHLAPIKADFIYRHLTLLSEQLDTFGIELVHLKASDFEDQVSTLANYCHEHNITQVFANSEPEVDEQQRDEAVRALDITLTTFDSDVIVPVGRVLNQQGEMFKVLTPFKKAWLKYVQASGIDCAPYPKVDSKSAQPELRSFSREYDFDFPRQDSSRWPLADDVLGQVVPQFLAEKLYQYAEQRDIPSIKGTSGLSPYLAIGAISPRWLAIQLIQEHPELLTDMQCAEFSWLNELIWRDFYKHLMFHHPRLVKGENFQEKYNSLTWHNNEHDFQLWCQGKTGYPLVDAAMRQLIETGWMHNRLRMVVASFLTKHLLVDWRWGERFFMEHLIDGDYSANNGGWQWAASTGCDAQPYFRIFNPITQSEKFDPKGIFIRKYLPELQNIPDKQVHFPHPFIAKNGSSSEYWAPIVDHKEARLRALDFYK